MVRPGSIALLLLSLPAAAWTAPPATSEQSKQTRSFNLPPAQHNRFAEAEPFGRTVIGPNAHFGFGMFGLKSEKTHQQPVIGRDIIAPKQRRAGVGFSLKF